MAEKKSVGRPRKENPRVKPPSYRLKLSTIEEIDMLCSDLNLNRSELLEKIIENGINIIKTVMK